MTDTATATPSPQWVKCPLCRVTVREDLVHLPNRCRSACPLNKKEAK